MFDYCILCDHVVKYKMRINRRAPAFSAERAEKDKDAGTGNGSDIGCAGKRRGGIEWRINMKKITAADLAAMKKSGEKITMVTSYDYSTARLADSAGIESILVGDSLGMVMLGYSDTISVTMEDMIHHCAAVSRGAQNALVVCDMPFMSYQTSVYDAVKNAGRLMKEGRAGAVKLEGGVDFAGHIRAIVKASIPVCGHIGLTPQSVNAFGGFKVQGKTIKTAQRLIDDALAVEEAGAFAVVLECVPAELAEYVSGLLSIPTIGIGAGAGCGGQVLVYQDMLSMYGDFTPKFVKKFADVGSVMKKAFGEYIKEVKDGSFPAEQNTFKADAAVMDEIKKLYSGKQRALSEGAE